MRLAVLSDIHGNLPALEAVIADARARGADAFVNLGNSVSGPLWPRETAALLMREMWPTLASDRERQLSGGNIVAMGASDRFAYERLDSSQLAWLATRPATLDYLPDIFLCHGTPASDADYLLEEVGEDGAYPAPPPSVSRKLAGRPEKLVLCGRSHLPRVLWLGDGFVVANPGSVGLPAYGDPLPHWHAMETGSPRARYALVVDGMVDLIDVDYDFMAAVAKARTEGRRNWAFALSTGRVQ